jgi:hypothetical protein
MGFFSEDIQTEGDLRKAYFQLAKVYRGDTENFTKLVADYAKKKSVLAETIGSPNDPNRRARLLSAIVQEALEPLKDIHAYILLRGKGIDVTLARQCSIFTFLHAYNAIKAIDKEMFGDIAVLVGDKVNGEVKTLYPCTVQGDWVYMGKGERPVIVNNPTDLEPYGDFLTYANEKYALAISTKDFRGYCMEGSMQELKAML